MVGAVRVIWGVGAVVGLAAMPSLVVADAPTSTPQTVPAAPASSFVPIAPFRLLDTRSGVGTGGVTEPVGAGATIEVQVAGVGTIPADAVGVVLNLTGTGTTAPTWVTAWPSGTDRQETSVLNLTPGVDAPNMITGMLGGGRMSLYNFAGSTHLVADAAGYLIPSTSGRSGAPGPQGPIGPQGAPGPQGPPGLADVQTVQVGGTALANQGGGRIATCPVGKRVIGGGGGAQHTSLRMYTSAPSGTTGWTVTFARDAGAPGVDTAANFQVYAICATLTP